MAEVVVSPKGHVGAGGRASAWRHFGTGFLAAAAIPLGKVLAPVISGLEGGDWGPLLALSPSKLAAVILGGVAGGAMAGLYRLWERWKTEIKVEVPSVESGEGQANGTL